MHNNSVSQLYIPHLAQKAHPELLRLRLDPAVAEDVRLVATLRALVEAHVLHQPQHGHVHGLVQRHAASGVDERQVLRRRHHHRPRQPHLLAQADVRIPRSLTTTNRPTRRRRRQSLTNNRLLHRPLFSSVVTMLGVEGIATLSVTTDTTDGTYGALVTRSQGAAKKV